MHEIDWPRRVRDLGWVKPGAIALLAGVAVIMGSCSFVVVHPGTVGVVTDFGAVQDEILPEGLHLVIPVRTVVVPVNVRVQKIEDQASASSKDLQIVTSTVALNYYLDKSSANVVYQELGPAYPSTIIAPAIQESVKSSTARFTAEELITRRPEVKESIYTNIKERLVKYHLIVTDFSIVDFKFSPEFNRAIEDKQVAEQRALRARNDLQRIRTEADQARVKAEGDASAQLALARAESEAQKLLRETLTPDLIHLRTIQKWDGALPGVAVGDAATPFLSLTPPERRRPSAERP